MNSDFKDLLVILHQEGVRYLVVGGYAAIHYSQPRYTKDLDIWVEASSENAARLMKAFERFGVSTFGLVKEDFEVEGTQLNIGVPPVAIDFLTSLPGAEFGKAWSHREVCESSDSPVYYLSKEELIAAKKVAGRPIDLADIDEIERLDRE